jgi:AcrR family transcriptional regulator
LFRRRELVKEEPQTAPTDERATGWTPRSLWFTGPLAEEERRRPLTRQRVVAEALTIIAEEGVEALTMRTLAARLGVVPGALYRHVRNKEQLHDLVLDGVLAEVDCDVDPSLPWTERIKLLAHLLRAVLEDHPGVAGSSSVAIPWDPIRSPWPKRSCHRCTPPGSPTVRPASPSS